MSEEQPTFKVRDRRLFNADGTPREVEREDAPAETSTATSDAGTAYQAPNRNPTATAPAATASAQGQPSTSSQAPSERTSATAAAGATRTPPRQDEQAADAYNEEGEVPGAHDPASFINFLMSIASNAAAALGMMEHPVTGERGVDLALGKHWIDVLGMLQQKTRGNLAPQEQQIFEGLLSDLRMQYVSLTSTRPPASPRGFTGRDITGGK